MRYSLVLEYYLFDQLRAIPLIFQTKTQQAAKRVRACHDYIRFGYTTTPGEAMGKYIQGSVGITQGGP
jgi:hypothetical protein